MQRCIPDNLQMLTLTRIVLNKTTKAAGLALCVAVVAACSTAVQVPVVTPPVAVSQAREPLEPPMRAPRLGLALGGGAARGFAHVGVIQVLEENGIRPDVLTGTSAGSLVAALYASGKTATELERVAMSMDEVTLTDWALPILGRGLLRGDALARYVSQAVDGRTIENMALPLGVLATDLATGQGVLFRRGDVAQAVRASSAVPGLFAPVGIAGREYVDGGLVAPVPVQQARDMGAEVVLAVDISSAPEGNLAVGNIRVLLQTFAIMGQSINRHELATADVVVRPALAGVGSADFASRKRSIEAGRVAMLAALPQLKAQLSRLKPGMGSRP